MGLFEILFERNNPGAIGHYEKTNQPQIKNIWVLIIKTIICLGIVSFGIIKLVQSGSTIKEVLLLVLIFIAYCVIGYFIVPNPDYSNVGWFGGMMDNPFRFSDDINRFMIFMKILLYPGRFFAITFVQDILVIKNLFINKE